jgi:AraC-like DNA-binding protein
LKKVEEQQEPERFGLSPERLHQLALTVDRDVRHAKYFLDSQLSLASLSRKIGTNRSYLSQAIAYLTGVNFCSYINQLRIEEILQYKNLALQSEEALYNTALVCGFNCRRTFYRAFFREMGIMPADFVAQYKSHPK